MKNGDLIASNLAAFPALQIFCDRLQAENPECSLTVYLTLDGDYRLHLKADQQFPFFKLDHLFNSSLWSNAFLISHLSVAMDEAEGMHYLAGNTPAASPITLNKT